MTQKKIDYRFAALWRFATAITLLNILGHTYLGFEQSWAQPVGGLVTAYTLEIVLELLDAWASHRWPRFLGGWRDFISHMLPAHITGLAVPMLLYANDRLWPIAMATAIAIGSKYIFRVRVGPRTHHFLNPSNTGLAVTFLLFPWVGIAPPYHFTENVAGFWDWALPGLIILSGSYLNIVLTHKIWLILGWLGGFFVQAVVRGLILGVPVASTLLPMTGLAFILFTFYMISDPATTPFEPKAQVAFGASAALVYSLLVTILHVVFGMFFALIIVCTIRGLSLYTQAFLTRPVQTPAEVRQPVVARGTEV
jgi:enediyne biosynthesis protein E5